MVNSPCISHFFVTALQQRCSVVTNPDNGETVIIDGGGDWERLVAWIDQGIGEPDAQIGEFNGGERNVVASSIRMHIFDHSGHIPYLKEHYGLEWWLHQDDFFLQSLAQQSGRRWGFSLCLNQLLQKILGSTETLTILQEWTSRLFTQFWPAIHWADVVCD